MSQAPPAYTQQPIGNAGYNPQPYNPYYNQPQQPPYPAGYYNPNQQPQVIYVDRPAPPPRNNTSDMWLTSLLALCCGCLVGEVCCDSPCLCCVLPCPISIPRFR